MNILVCLSQIPETTSKINFTTGNKTIDYQDIQFIINPSDESALTKAMQIKEKIGATVTLIHVGQAHSEPTLRKAFAIGADRMIRIDTPAIDGQSVAKHIFNTIKNENFDLILCGKESLDFHGAMVGGVLATLLNINFIDGIIAIDIQEKSAQIEREIEQGKEILEATFPLLVTVEKELIGEADLKIPNIRNIMNARKAPIEVISVDEILTQTQVVSLEKPSERLPIKMIDPNDLDQLIYELHNVKKII